MYVFIAFSSIAKLSHVQFVYAYNLLERDSCLIRPRDFVGSMAGSRRQRGGFFTVINKRKGSRRITVAHRRRLTAIGVDRRSFFSRVDRRRRSSRSPSLIKLYIARKVCYSREKPDPVITTLLCTNIME